MRILMRFLPIIALLLSSCMQHNGNIGDWFGTWKVESISINGISDAAYEGNLFFQFQTDIVCLNQVDTDVSNSSMRVFGRWRDEGSTLVLDFSYTADGMDGSFTPPEDTYLSKGENILKLQKESSRRMLWTLEKTDTSQIIIYSLKKQ